MSKFNADNIYGVKGGFNGYNQASESYIGGVKGKNNYTNSNIELTGTNLSIDENINSITGHNG